jgi:hypothetical protein
LLGHLLALNRHLLVKLLALQLHLLTSQRLLASRGFCLLPRLAFSTTTAHESSLVLLFKINGPQHPHHLPLTCIKPDLAV